MRDRVMITLGGAEHPLLPAFEVLDVFEERVCGILDHLNNLTNGTARLRDRAMLVMLAANAAADGDWKLDATMQRMFEAGLWHQDLLLREIELVEKLLYTPEQYAAKKAARAEDQQTLESMFDDISSFSTGSQSST